MRSRRVGGRRQFARAGAIASIALIGMVFSANAAIAGTAIGSAAGTAICNLPVSTVQISSSSGAYTVPAGGGSISSWSTQATAWPGPVALQVWRPTATPLVYLLVGSSPLVTLATGTLNTLTLATPIPVQAGDLLGLRVQVKAACLQFSSATDAYGIASGVNPTKGSMLAFTSNKSMQLDVAAIVDAVAVTPPPPPVTAPPPPPVTTPPPSGNEGGQRGGEDYRSSGCSSSAPFAAKSTGKSDWDEGDTDGKFSRHRNHKHNCDD